MSRPHQFGNPVGRAPQNQTSAASQRPNEPSGLACAEVRCGPRGQMLLPDWPNGNGCRSCGKPSIAEGPSGFPERPNGCDPRRSGPVSPARPAVASQTAISRLTACRPSRRSIPADWSSLRRRRNPNRPLNIAPAAKKSQRRSESIHFAAASFAPSSTLSERLTRRDAGPDWGAVPKQQPCSVADGAHQGD